MTMNLGRNGLYSPMQRARVCFSAAAARGLQRGWVAAACSGGGVGEDGGGRTGAANYKLNFGCSEEAQRSRARPWEKWPNPTHTHNSKILSPEGAKLFGSVFLCGVLAEASSRRHFAVAMTAGERARFLTRIKSHPRDYYTMLGTVNAERSDCSRPADRISIHDGIRGSVGFARLSRMVSGTPRLAAGARGAAHLADSAACRTRRHCRRIVTCSPLRAGDGGGWWRRMTR
jgi:hypothetical protein